MRLLLAALLLLLQQPQQTSIQGTVVKAGTSTPISGALVELRRATTPLTLIASATTNADGKFSLQNVPPGDYRLSAQHDSGVYVRTEYLQRNPQTHGAVLTITGQPLRDLQIGMTSTGSIAGRVTDLDGEPAMNARVMALQAAYRDGQRVMNVVEALRTNDNGEYRLFWLPPGRYFIAVQAVDQRMPAFVEQVISPGRITFREDGSSPVVTLRMLDSGEAIEEIRVSAYFGGGTDPANAREVNLESSQNVSGIDVSLFDTRLRTVHVRGTVTNAATGQPAEKAAIRLIPKSYAGAFAILPAATTDAKGDFNLAGVLPGSYWLFAVLGGQSFGGPQYGNFSGPGLNLNSGPNVGSNALLSIEVGSALVDNVSVPVRPGRSIPIRASVEAGTLNLAQMTVGFVRSPDLLGMPAPPGGQIARLAADGTFTMMGVGPGDYRLEVARLPPDAYVKSLRLGPADLLESGLHIANDPGNEKEGSIELVVSTNGGAIEGSTVNAKLELVGNATVVMIPDAPRRTQASLYKVASSDLTGKFSIRGVTPGAYRLFAWESVDDGAWQDAAFLRAFENRGAAVRASEGSRQTIQLTVIPAGAAQ
jgi:protocatechuate 3,4-dioxygenase beta subunit